METFEIQTPLHGAAFMGSVMCVNELLSLGANVYLTNVCAQIGSHIFMILKSIDTGEGMSLLLCVFCFHLLLSKISLID